MTALSVIEKIVCRSSNRVFVGLPLCMFTTRRLFSLYLSLITLGRNPDWIDLNITGAFDMVAGGTIISVFPKFMRS